MKSSFILANTLSSSDLQSICSLQEFKTFIGNSFGADVAADLYSSLVNQRDHLASTLQKYDENHSLGPVEPEIIHTGEGAPSLRSLCNVLQLIVENSKKDLSISEMKVHDVLTRVQSHIKET